jgi:homoserine dehydrogenase
VDVHVHPTFANRAEPDAILDFTNNWTSKYFIRVSAIDAPGVLASVASCFAKENVSIATMMQKDAVEDGRVPLIFITHATQEQSMLAALKHLDPAVCKLESMIRVED